MNKGMTYVGKYEQSHVRQMGSNVKERVKGREFTESSRVQVEFNVSWPRQ